MKKIIALFTLCALTFTASAQFRPSGPVSIDLLSGSAKVITTGAISNFTATAYIGKDGFCVTPYLVGTNAGTAVIAVYAYPLGNGSNPNSSSTYLGTVAMNGTNPVRASIFVPGTTFCGCGTVRLTVTNAHTDSVTLSNLTVTAW